MGLETNETSVEQSKAQQATVSQEMAVSTAPRKKKNQCCSSFGSFLYNRETGEVMGRTPVNWCKLLAFYLVFWGFLAAYFAAFYQLFYCQISDRFPRLIGDQGLMKDSSRSVTTPGMGFKPMPDTGNSLIRFTSGTDNSTYYEYVNDIEQYLQAYTNTSDFHNAKHCREGEKSTANNFCLFDEFAKFPKCSVGSNYGYDDGHPCIMLRLNRIIGWEPQPITCSSDKSCTGLADKDIDFFNREGRPGVPLTKLFDGRSVVFTCEGVTPADRENIAGIEWFPSSGSISTRYFPYMNQKNYTTPFVMAKLHVTPGILVLVRCRAWAQNIRNVNFLSREGAVHFELLVDLFGVPPP